MTGKLHHSTLTHIPSPKQFFEGHNHQNNSNNTNNSNKSLSNDEDTSSHDDTRILHFFPHINKMNDSSSSEHRNPKINIPKYERTSAHEHTSAHRHDENGHEADSEFESDSENDEHYRKPKTSQHRKRPHLRKTLTKTATYVDANFTQIKLSLGARIRKPLYKIEDTLGPFIKKIIPNFVIAHYCYIILWIILGSVVIYGEQNMDYTDALLFATGASTQGGLATLQINEMKLYQQIAVYVICMLTTPIFIHGSLTFLRLYWYEKRFDNIQLKSIQQYNMRRTATIANFRSATMSARTITGTNMNTDRNYDSHNASEGLASRMQRYEKQHDGKSFPNLKARRLSKLDLDLFNRSPTDSFHNSPIRNSFSIPLNNITPNDSKKAHNLSIPIEKASGLSDDEDFIDNHIDSDHSNDHVISSSEDENPINNIDNEIKQNEVHLDKPNIKFAELPKPVKSNRKATSSTSKKLPGKRRKQRKILKERKLKKLKKKSNKMVDNEREFLKKEVQDIASEDSALGFTIKPLNDSKKTRSLSVPAPNEDNFFSDDDDASGDISQNNNNSLEPISTNDAKINQKLKAMDRSHTIHIPDFSKHFFTMPRRNTNEQSNKNDVIESDEEDKEDNENSIKQGIPNNNRRYSNIFGKTFTGMSRRAMSDVSDLSDDEIADIYGPEMHTNFVSWKPQIGRNSKLLAFSNEQKFELGGVEYQAMKLLSKILVAYYVGFHIAIVVFFLPFIETKTEYQDKLRAVGVSPTWWAFFTAQSSFNDLGYSLNPDSMMMFAQNAYVLIISGIFILLGNTGFPIFLRLIIWLMKLFTRPLTMTHDSLSFLLEHPRRCFTLLFPSGPTWWLSAVLFLLNAIDWVLFIILDFGKESLAYLPKGYRVLDGLYQAFSTRTAGFNVVDLATLNPAIQLSYMVMMYISVLPLAISIRRTNVYEEQSLGVYKRDDENERNTDSKPKLQYIGTHLRKQLSFDLWFVFLAIFIICIVESKRIEAGDIRFGIFQIMFEVISAYGTVGLSLGYPSSNTSLCGEFHKLSKLVIIATLIRGRHRGLPNKIDRAIMLSNDKLNLRDDLEAYHAIRRNNTLASDSGDMFPSISRVTSLYSGPRGATKRRNTENSIATSFKEGNIPWSKIAKKSGKFVGHVASNILTVSGTPLDKYTRNFTSYDEESVPRRSYTQSSYQNGINDIDSNFENNNYNFNNERNQTYDNFNDRMNNSNELNNQSHENFGNENPGNNGSVPLYKVASKLTKMESPTPQKREE